MRSEPRRADEKNDTELRPVSHTENDRGEVAPAVHTQDQEWNRKKKGDLREGHKVDGGERSGRETEKRLLE